MILHPLHRSAFRPHLLLGAERKPMLLLAVACGGLVITSYNIVAIGIAIGLWLTFHPLLVWMAKVDPDMVGIYLRQLRYPRFIPAFTTPFRKTVGYRVWKH